MLKTKLRQDCLQKIHATSLTQEQKLLIDKHVNAFLMQLLDRIFFLATSPVCGFYFAMKSEIDVSSSIDFTLRKFGLICLPCVKNGTIIFSELRGANYTDIISSLEPSKFQKQIKEPIKKIPIIPQTICVPCVGISTDGFRLGRGGGYYDRFLAGQPSLITVGVCIDDTANLENSWVEPQDTRLDIIITEKGIRNTKAKKP